MLLPISKTRFQPQLFRLWPAGTAPPPTPPSPTPPANRWALTGCICCQRRFNPLEDFLLPGDDLVDPPPGGLQPSVPAADKEEESLSQPN